MALTKRYLKNQISCANIGTDALELKKLYQRSKLVMRTRVILGKDKKIIKYAAMAELADALVLGASG